METLKPLEVVPVEAATPVGGSRAKVRGGVVASTTDGVVDQDEM